MILVTGGAGFIGSHIVDALICDGHDVRVLDVLLPEAHSRTPDYLNDKAELIEGDVSDPKTVRRAIERVDAVCHQASMVGLGQDFRDTPDFVRHNDLGTAVLLQQLAMTNFTGRLVLASSMVVYGEGAYTCPEHGDVTPPPRDRRDLEAGRFEAACPICHRDLRPTPVAESAPPDPRSVYAATKVHQEHLCFAFARETDVPVTALRYHNVYGPRMPRNTPYAGVAAIFASAVAANRPPRVFEDGRQLRDFVHVRDVARANVLALTREEPADGAFNIASGEPRTITDMAATLTKAAGPGTPIPVTTGAFRRGDVRHVFASTEKAADQLNFRAVEDFTKGMAEFARAPLRAAA